MKRINIWEEFVCQLTTHKMTSCSNPKFSMHHSWTHEKILLQEIFVSCNRKGFYTFLLFGNILVTDTICDQLV